MTCRRAAFSLGSNQGDRVAMLQGAVDALAAVPELSVTAVSPVFETDPVGGPEQPDYLNAVAVADTSLSPRELLVHALAIEQRFGRVRNRRWGPRTLDIDLLAVADLVVDEPGLTVPHPRLLERAFVLVPWASADPTAVLPDGSMVRELASAADRAGVRERPDLVLMAPAVEPRL